MEQTLSCYEFHFGYVSSVAFVDNKMTFLYNTSNSFIILVCLHILLWVLY